MKLYFGEELSMVKIQKKTGRSRSTIHNHIHDHIDAVHRTKFCPSCKRVNGKFYTITKREGD
jgi:hypothetical protein